MTHAHVPTWILCPVCGIQAPLDCEVCRAVHHKLHHHKRRRRIK